MEKKITVEEVRGAVARGWCHPKNGHKEMDADLANAIVEQVAELLAVHMRDA